MVIPNKLSSPSLRKDADFEGETFSVGADEVTCVLTTDSLQLKGSRPASGQCTIVERLNSRWDIKSLIDLKAVQKALSNKTTIQKLGRAKNVDEILDLLALTEIRMLADYSELQAQTYVKGHILSEKLGGMGVNANLTPMSASSNSNYRRSFEAGLIKHLGKLEKEEDQTGYRVRIRFHAKCKGNMKPWWGSSATKETANMLKRIPKSLDASWRFDSFFRDGKPSERIPRTKIPKAVAKDMPLAMGFKPEKYSLDL